MLTVDCLKVDVWGRLVLIAVSQPQLQAKLHSQHGVVCSKRNPYLSCHPCLSDTIMTAHTLGILLKSSRPLK